MFKKILIAGVAGVSALIAGEASAQACLVRPVSQEPIVVESTGVVDGRCLVNYVIPQDGLRHRVDGRVKVTGHSYTMWGCGIHHAHAGRTGYVLKVTNRGYLVSMTAQAGSRYIVNVTAKEV